MRIAPSPRSRGEGAASAADEGATRGSMRPSPGAFGATLSPLRGARDLGLLLHPLDRLELLSHALVALAADADRPVDRGGHTDLLPVLGRDLRQVVAPDVARAGAVGAVHDGDVLARQLNAGVDVPDGGVVPLRDLAEEDVGEDA